MKKRRFSLRSLLLLVLALAAGAALWKNAPPWRIEHAFAGFSEPCDAVLLSPDGKWILAEIKRRGEKGKLDYTKCNLWNVESGRCTELDPVVQRRTDENEPGYDGAYISTEFSSDSRYALTGFSTMRAYHFKLWDLQKGSEVVLGPPSFSTKHAMFSPNGRFLMRTSNQALQLFDLHTSSRILEEYQFTDAKFSTDSSLLAVAYNDNSAKVFETSNGGLLQRINKRDDCDVRTIRHVSREQLFAFAERRKPSSELTETFTVVLDLNDPLITQRRLPGIFLGTSPDGTKGILADGGNIEFVDTHSLRRYRSEIEGKQLIHYWSPDGALFFSGGHSSLYETRFGRRLFAGGTGYGTPLADFSRFVSIFGDPEDLAGVTIHDMRDGRLLQTIPSESLNVLDHFPSEYFVTQNTKSHVIHYWSRYRPEAWWGLGLLPEAWVLFVLIGALGWSVRRDWNNT